MFKIKPNITSFNFYFRFLILELVVMYVFGPIDLKIKLRLGNNYLQQNK